MMPRVQNQEIELYNLSIGAAGIGPTIVQVGKSAA